MNCDGILDELKYYRNYYQELLDNFQSELKTLPEGRITCKIIKSYYRFYFCHQGPVNANNRPSYLISDKISLIKSLCRKRFVLDSIRRLKKCIQSMDIFLNSFSPYDSTNIIAGYPNAVADLCGVSNTVAQSDSGWAVEDYKKNESYPENLIHWTASGLRVRSKSESIIATLLEKEKISYRYEAALELNGKTYYPDFTILRPRDNKIIFWEHFGMVDEELYRKSMHQKLSSYGESDIFPWDQLITTFETKDSPIDARNIQRIIKAFLLS